MNRKSFWIATGLLVVPVVIFYILNAGSQRFDKLPILGERIPPDGVTTKDTVYYQVPEFSVITQTADTLHSSDLDQSIVVVNFFFTSCKEICPTMNLRLSGMYEKYKEFAELQFLTISVDPETDSVPALAAYAAKYKADPAIWHFANPGSLDNLVQLGQGFLLPVSKEDKTIDHSQQLILMDKQKRIRGVYDSSSDADLKNLEGDIKVLLYEYHPAGK